MRIGIDGIPLTEIRTGVGHYTFEIATELARYSPSDSFDLLSNLPFNPLAICAQDDLPPNLTFINPHTNVLTKHWWSVGLPLHIRKNKLSVFHGTNYDVPILSGRPTVLTIHDLSLLLYPETHEKRRVRRARRRLPAMTRLATRIIAPTRSVQNELSEHLHVPTEKITVIPEAPRSCFRPLPEIQSVPIKSRFGIENQFILYVGTIEPRKNLITLIRAFEEILKSTTLRPQLVLVGRQGWLNEELLNHIGTSAARRKILMTGYLSDEALQALYCCCTVMVYPALYEGAGLPPIEAMACGAAVITTDTAAISEMVGSGARLFSPRDYRELARHIVELLTDDQARTHLIRRGLIRASEFTWDSAARRTYNVYQEAIDIDYERRSKAAGTF